MDKFFQALLGLKQPSLPADFRSEHFSTQDYRALLDSWAGGNVLSEPQSLADMAEKYYTFADDAAYFADPDISQMWRDGLGRFVTELWIMIATKRGLPLPAQ